MSENGRKNDAVNGGSNHTAGTHRSGYLSHVAGGAIINFSGIIARTVILYIYTFMLARMLTADELGEYFLLSIFINYLALVATVGFGLGVVRFVAMYVGEGRFHRARNTMWASLVIAVPVAVVCAGGFALAAPFINGLMFHDSTTAVAGMRIFAIAIPLLVAAQIFNSTTQGLHQMKYQVFSRDLGEQLSKLGFSGMTLVMGAGIIGVVGANVASVVVALCMAFGFAVIALPKSETDKKGLMLPESSFIWYSVPLAISGIVVALQLKVDTLLLGYFTSSADVGFYGVAIKVSIFAQKINLAFATVFAPVISDLWNRQKIGELSILFKTVARWIFILSLPVFIVIIVLAEPIMGLFGEAFVFSSSALILVAFGELINNSTGATGLMVVMSGRSKLELLNVVVALLLNAGICLLLIPQHGLVGAAFANMTSIAAANLLRTLEVWLLMRLHAYDISYLKPLLAGATGAAILFVISRFAITDIGPMQLLLLAVALCIYYALAMLMMGLSDQDKAVLTMAKSRLIGT